MRGVLRLPMDCMSHGLDLRISRPSTPEGQCPRRGAKVEAAVEELSYEGRPVAVVFNNRVRLVQEVEFGDPAIARFVEAIAAHILSPGRIAEGMSIEDGDCEFMARWLLMPNAAFAPLAHLPDERLADPFEVPLAEVARKRDDLARLAAS